MIRKEIKLLLLQERVSMTELVGRINEVRDIEHKTTISSLSNKLTRGTISYREVLEIYSVLGFNVNIIKRTDLKNN